MNVDEIIAELCSERADVYADYLALANGPLQRYKGEPFIHTHGDKKGESLFAHVMTGIGVLARLAQLLELSEEETRVLMASFTVHDLNKLPEWSESKIGFNRLTTRENVAKALRDVEMEKFFPEWEDYLPDVDLLVRSHSGHHHTSGESIIPAHNPYRLGLENVKRLVPLMRAADVADLSRTLDERKHKATLLSHLNSIAPTCIYEFTTHRIAEQRGLLTNLLHEVAQAHIESRGGVPLLYYPDGIAYLIPHGFPGFDAKDYEVIGARFAAGVERKVSGGFAEFIRSTNQGIKIEAQCLEQDAAEVWREVLDMIRGRSYKRLDDLCAKMEERLRKQAEKDPKADALLTAGAHRLPADEAILRLGELVRTYYIFLADHFSGKDKLDPWARLYELLDIPVSAYEAWTPLDARYDRGYVVGVWLAERRETLETVWPRLVADAEQLCGGREKGESPFAALAEYARRNLCLSPAGHPEPDWGAGLRRYVASQHKQCSMCGSEYPTQEMMAADVPKDQKVQQFSNRLAAGSRSEPKRYVCSVCRTQYLLDKLNVSTLDASKRYFAHFYPYAFFTPDYLQSIRAFWNKERGKGIESLLVKVEAVWREYDPQQGYPALSFAATKAFGTPIPHYPEAVGNIFTTPINAPGDNATERFVYAMQSAMLWKLWLGCRLALTESPEPPFGGDWPGDLFIDGVPASLRGLLPHNEIPADQGKTLVVHLTALHRLRALVFDAKSRRDPLLALARSLSFDALEPFWVMDRLIQRKTEGGRPGGAAFLRRDALPHLERLVEKRIGKEETLSHIKRMAEIAWQGGLKGESLKDTALAKPLDAALAALGGWDKTIETPEDLRAVTTKEVEEAIERVTDPKYWGRTKIERVGEFVGVLFDGLLKETYKDDVSALLANRRRIRAAFLHYVAGQIRSKHEEKEEAK